MRNKLFTSTCLSMTLLLALGACDSLPGWMGNDEKEKILAGDRVAVLEYRKTLEPDSTLADAKIDVKAPETNAEWQSDTAVQMAGHENLTVTGLNRAGSVSVGDGKGWESVLVPQPVVGDGMLFAMDSKGHISAHDAENISQIKWTSDEAVSEDEDDIAGGGLAYAGHVLYVTTGRGALLALSVKDGALYWRQQADVPIRAAPVVDEGRVYAVTIDNQLLCYDTNTGKPLWSHRGIRESALYLGSVSPAVLNGIVMTAYTSGELYALRAEDGSPIWSDTLTVNRRTSANSTFSGIDATPLIKDNVVYGISNSGLMVANSLSNGRGQWDIELSGHLTPWAVEEYLFVITSEHRLLAVRRSDGAVKWATSLVKMKDGKDVTPPLYGPVMINSQLAVITNAGEIMLYSPQDGTEQQRVEIPDGVATGPLIAGGKLYLLTRDATLSVLQ